MPLTVLRPVIGLNGARVSGAIHQEHIYAHLGWRRHGSQWVYLHAGGALGVGGPVNGLQVQPPAALQHYQLRVPANHGQLTTAASQLADTLGRARPDQLSSAGERVSGSPGRVAFQSVLKRSQRGL